MFPATPAEADVVVSNFGQGNTTQLGVGAVWQAQKFTTGSDSAFLILGSIEVRVATALTPPGRLRAELWSEDGSGDPDSKIVSLTVPSTLAAGNVAFTAPPNTKLAPATPYFLVLYGASAGLAGTVWNTFNDNEDAGRKSGWSIANQRWWRAGHGMTTQPGASWSTHTNPVKIRVNSGLAEVTLEGLLLDGSTDGSRFLETVTLSPPFAPETRHYAATVAGSITHVRLTPTLDHDLDEVIVYRADDVAGATTLSVDNLNADLALNVGENVIVMTVTAKGPGGEQKRYTFTVTRQGGSGPPPTGGPGGPGGPPPADDDEDEPSTCNLVAPYWSGPTGGFTVMPAAGRTSVSVTCGGSTTEYSAENGVVTRLVRGSCPGGLRLEGAAPGGWYWQHGERNAAAAPFVCSEALGGPPAVVPGGVVADATADATWFRHDTARLVGIVPHLEGNECSEYVTPYWQGDGGVVVRPAEGRTTARVRVQCGATLSTLTASPGADGVAAELVRKDYCTDEEGEPRQGKLTVTGAAPGGWYWISGERNAAVAPLMCADLLGGPAAVDPGGVLSRATEDGTYFSHDADRLIGVVPHVAPARDQ